VRPPGTVGGPGMQHNDVFPLPAGSPMNDVHPPGVTRVSEQRGGGKITPGTIKNRERRAPEKKLGPDH